MGFHLRCLVRDQILSPAPVGSKLINMEARITQQKPILLRTLHFRNGFGAKSSNATDLGNYRVGMLRRAMKPQKANGFTGAGCSWGRKESE